MLFPRIIFTHQMRSNYQQAFQEQQEPQIICTTLTPEEVEIALSYLKRRFSNYPLELIVSTLDHYIHQKKSVLPRRNHKQALIQPSFKRNNLKPAQLESNEAIINSTSKDEKRKKTQQNLKVIAALYCQQGYDYHKANRLIPQITQSNYRNALICIVNTAFNELLLCLKEQSRIQLQVTPFQKSLIRQQLLYSHRWMGMMSVSALTTFFKLIEKKFQKVKVSLSDEQLIELYTIIAKRLSDKNLNLSQIEAPTISFGKQVEKQAKTFSLKSILSEQDLMALAKSFIKQKTIEKTMEALQRQEKKRWNCKQVEKGIQLIIKKSIRKLMNCIIKIEQALREIIQSDIDQNIDEKIMESGKSDLKVQLVKYYTIRKPSRQQNEQLVSLVYAFIRSQPNHNQSLDNIDHPEIQYQRDFGVNDNQWDQPQQVRQLTTNKEKGNIEDDEDIQWLIE